VSTKVRPHQTYARLLLDDGTTEYGYSPRINKNILKQLLVKDRVCIKYLRDLPLREGSPQKMIIDIRKEP
jgi:hypothetical protein